MRNIQNFKANVFKKTTLSLLLASSCLYGIAATAQSSLETATTAQASATSTASARVNHGQIVDALSSNSSAATNASATAAANVAASADASARRSVIAITEAGNSTSQSANVNGAASVVLNAVAVAQSEDEVSADAGAVANAILTTGIRAGQTEESANNTVDAISSQTVTLGADVAANVSSVVDVTASGARDTVESVNEAVEVNAGLAVAAEVANEAAIESSRSLRDMDALDGDLRGSISSFTEVTSSVTGGLGL
ncbi:MAG: hypothetical protein V4751_13520 [Pseudomonadota bacterium]